VRLLVKENVTLDPKDAAVFCLRRLFFLMSDVFLIETLRIQILCTIRAETMTEGCIRVLRQIFFQLIPVSLVISDFFTG
jgi:hypothetical protein